MDTRRQSQEITKLKLKLRAEKIGRMELQAENQAIRNALHAMEQSLVGHKRPTRMCNMKGLSVKWRVTKRLGKHNA